MCINLCITLGVFGSSICGIWGYWGIACYPDMGISVFGYLDIAKPLVSLCILTRGYCYTRDQGYS
jgi:hypothetical protein